MTLMRMSCWSATPIKRRSMHIARRRTSRSWAASSAITLRVVPTCRSCRKSEAGSILGQVVMDGFFARHTKPGTAPGTLAGRPPVPDEALDFTLVEYTPEKCVVLHGVEIDECRFHLGTPEHTWIDVGGRPSSEMLRDLGTAFDLHPLALEDVFHGNQRAKIDIYGKQGFIVLNDPVYEEGEIKLRQVSIF